MTTSNVSEAPSSSFTCGPPTFARSAKHVPRPRTPDGMPDSDAQPLLIYKDTPYGERTVRAMSVSNSESIPLSYSASWSDSGSESEQWQTVDDEVNCDLDRTEATVLRTKNQRFGERGTREDAKQTVEQDAQWRPEGIGKMLRSNKGELQGSEIEGQWKAIEQSRLTAVEKGMTGKMFTAQKDGTHAESVEEGNREGLQPFKLAEQASLGDDYQWKVICTQECAAQQEELKLAPMDMKYGSLKSEENNHSAGDAHAQGMTACKTARVEMRFDMRLSNIENEEEFRRELEEEMKLVLGPLTRKVCARI